MEGINNIEKLLNVVFVNVTNLQDKVIYSYKFKSEEGGSLND